MNYNQILTYFLSTSIITGGIVYLAKKVLDKFSEAGIEKYKSTLQNESELFKHKLNFEADIFRQELIKNNTEHQIKYSKLYEERGQVIKQTYHLLYELEKSLINLTTIFQGPNWTVDKERDNIADDAINLLETHLEQNRIYFSAELCKNIESIIDDSFQVTIEMKTAKREQNYINEANKIQQYISTEELLKPSKTWRQLEKKVQNDINKERLNLAQEFRNLIGVD